MTRVTRVPRAPQWKILPDYLNLNGIISHLSGY